METTFLENIKIAQSKIENDTVPSLRKNITSEERARMFR